MESLESRLLLAAQIITPTQTELIVTPGVSESVEINYSTSDNDNTLSTFGFRLHFDSSQLDVADPTNVLLENNVKRVPNNPDAPLFSIEDDTVNNFDQDPLTDKFVLVAWVAIAGDFPNLELPTPLYTFNFAPKADFAGETTMNFTASALALNFTFESTPLTVRTLNQPPRVGPIQPLRILEGGTGTIGTEFLNEDDPDDAGAGLTYTITSGPANGTVNLGGTPESRFTQADIDNDLVTYVHNGSETLSDSFEFSLSDGLEDGATPAAETFSIEITPVNDNPVITSDGMEDTAAVGADENQTAVTTVRANDVDLPAQMLTFSITGGADGDKFAIGPVSGVLTFKSAPDFENPTAVGGGNVYDVQVTVTDNGTPTPLTDVQDIAVTVQNVNDAPVITPVNDPSAVNEDTPVGPLSVTVGDVDTLLTMVTLTGTSSDQTLVPDDGIVITGTGATRMVTITPVANQSGTATITLTANDGAIDSAPESFDVTFNAVNDAPSFSVASPLNVTVAEGVADVTTITGTDPDNPEMVMIEITGGTNRDLFTIDETLGAAPLTRTLSFSSTPPDFDPDTPANNNYEVILTVTDDESQQGSETLTVNVTVAQFGIVPPTSAMVFENQNVAIVLDAVVTPGDTPGFSIVDNGTADDGQLFDINPTSGLVTFKTNPDFEIPSAVGGGNEYQFTAKVVDQTVTQGATQAITVTVKNVDEAPVFTIETPSHTSNEDPMPALVTVPGFATGIDPIEPGQAGSLDFTFTPTGTTGGLTFTQAPDIDAAGTLTYQATADSNGTATFDVTLMDSGSTDNGGANTSSPPVSVTITVNAVNDPPTFDLPASPDQTVDEDAGPQTVPNFLTNPSVGPENEAVNPDNEAPRQTLNTPNVTNDNNGLFSMQPAIDSSGTLTYETAPNASGMATVTVTLSDTGGTPNGGADTSAPQEFTITVNPINDPPILATNTEFSVREGETRVITMSQLKTTDVDDGPADLTYTVSTLPTAGNLLLDGVLQTGEFMFKQQDINDEKLSYQHTDSEQLVDSFTFTVADGGEDGVQPIGPQTFEIRVLTILSEIPTQLLGTGLGIVTIPVSAAVVEGDVPALSADGLPGFGSFIDNGDGTGLFTFDPQSGQEGMTDVTLNATTSDGTDSVTFTVDVVTGPTEISNEVTHFVNAGGPAIPGLATADTGFASPFRNTGTPFSTSSGIDLSDPSVGDVPSSIFQTLRYDVAGGPEMQFSFPVDGGDYRVNLYFAEIYEPAFSTGSRVFDVAIEGTTVLEDLDVFREVGGNAGLVETFDVTTDSSLDITFLHQVENPIISAIEIINRNQVPSQSAPVLLPIGNQQASEGQTTTIDVRATDAQLDDVTFDVQGLPAFATFIDNENGTGRVTVNAVEGDAGEYPVTVTTMQLVDGLQLTDAESFVISVQATNDPPQLDPVTTVMVDEGGTVTIGAGTLNGTDPDDDNTTLTYTLDSVPANGTLRLDGASLAAGGSFTQGDVNGGLLEYVHDGEESTSDSFSVTLADGGEDGAAGVPGMVSITVNPINDSPTITRSNDLAVRPSGTRVITVAQLSGFDPDDTPPNLTYTVTGPTEGAIFVNNVDQSDGGTFTQQDLIDGVVEYRNTNDQATTDSFGVSLADGGEDGSVPATATISVSIEDVTILAPIPDQTLATQTGQVDIPVAAASVNGVAPALTVTGLPDFGTFTDNGDGTGLFTFDPQAGDDGSSTINLTATAGEVTETVSFGLTVEVGVTQAPADPILQRINAGGPNVTDPRTWSADLGGGGSAIRNTGISFSTGAAIDVSDESLEGTPASIFQTLRYDAAGGPEMQFSFPVDPGQYQVNLYFAETYEPAFSVGARIFDVAVEGNLAIDNLDVFSEVGGNAGLMRTVNNVMADSSLDIAFLHQVENPIVSAIEIINLNQVPVQTPPILDPIGNVTVDEGQTSIFTVAAPDAQSDPVSAVVAGEPSFVSVSEPDGNGNVTVTISPVEGDAGQYPVNVTVTQDGNPALTDSESLVLTVVGVNESPVLTTNNPLTVQEGANGTIDSRLLNSSDPDDGPGQLSFSFVMTGGPSHGQLFVNGTALSAGDTFTQADINANRVEYRNAGGEASTDSFDFMLADGGEDGAAPVEGTFTINITPFDDPPTVSVNTGVTVREDATRVLTAAELSSSDPDNLPGQLVYTVTAGPTGGTLRVDGAPLSVSSTFTQQQLNDGLVAYSQDGTFAATDSFGFNLSDGTTTVSGQTFEIAITQRDPFALDVNAGGPAVGGYVPDDGIQNGAGIGFGTGATIDGVSGDVPASVFQTVLYAPAGGGDLSFDVELEAGVSYDVTLLFAEVYGPAFSTGARVFDVSIDGMVVLDNFDVFAAAGAGNTAVARTFRIDNSDGNLDIDLGRGVQSPAIAGFRIREIDSAFSDPGSVPGM